MRSLDRRGCAGGRHTGAVEIKHQRFDVGRPNIDTEQQIVSHTVQSYRPVSKS
jgi:hypothetical protein